MGHDAQLTVELEAKLLQRLGLEWEGLNQVFLGGALRRPVFRLSDTRARLGQWNAAMRSLEVSRALVLEQSWGEVVEVLKHELAHQYVDEFLRVDEAPHGPAFRSVCERLGINGASTMALREATDSEQVEGEAGRLVARIRKLLALAESPNQHEAETAAAAAQKLMLRFNIEVDRGEAPQGYSFRHLGEPSGRTYEHQRRVSVILHEHFFVEAIWVPVYRPRAGKRGSVLEIFGTHANLEMANYVHDFLHEAAERLWAEHKRAQAIRSNKERRSFLAGVMAGFEAQLDAQRGRFQEQGLVWVPQAALARDFRRRHPYVRSVRGGGGTRGEAYEDGHRVGGQIVLSKPVSSSTNASRPRALKA